MDLGSSIGGLDAGFEAAVASPGGSNVCSLLVLRGGSLALEIQSDEEALSGGYEFCTHLPGDADVGAGTPGGHSGAFGRHIDVDRGASPAELAGRGEQVAGGGGDVLCVDSRGESTVAVVW